MRAKLVVAASGFKGTVTPLVANAIIAEQLTRFCMNGFDILLRPLADGGEHSLSVLAEYRRAVPSQMRGPFTPFQDESALDILLLGQKSMMFEAAPHLLSRRPGNPERIHPDYLSSRGLGNVIARLLRQHPSSITVGLGGAETYDGGAGALQALGAKFRDRSGGFVDFFDTSESIPAKLNRIHDVNLASHQIEALKAVQLSLLCDSSLTLIEARDSIVQKLPQNEASPESTKVSGLIRGLQNLARVLSHKKDAEIGRPLTSEGLAVDPWRRQGLASGGASATSLNLALGGDLALGSAYFADAANLSEAIRGAVAVITGEGSLDRSSLQGKATSAVLETAQRFSVPSYALVGSIHESLAPSRRIGPDGTLSQVENFMNFRRVYELFPENPSSSRIGMSTALVDYLKVETPKRIALSIMDLCPSFSA